MEAISFVVIAIIISSLAYAFLKKVPVSHMIVLSNFIIFLLTLPHLPLSDLAFRPSYLHSYRIYTIFTSMFLHGDFSHIIFNMIGIIFIGFPFEQQVGMKKFAAIYFISGFFAAIFYTLIDGGNTYLIGASGAIFGILGAFAAAYPFKKVAVPLFMPIIIFMRLPVVAVALLYAGIETLYTFSGVTDGIAHSAHIGGFVAGVFLSPFIKMKIEKKSIGVEKLREFVVTEKHREIYKKAMDADEPELREAWISYLLNEISCPECGGKLEIKDGEIYCRNCGYRK